MKTIVNLSALILLLVSCKMTNSPSKKDSNSIQIQVNTSLDTSDDTIAYAITIDSNNQKRATVSMSFTPQNDTLYMAAGANQLPNRWATFVHELRAVDALGNKIALDSLSDAKWKLQSPPKEKITVSYELWLDHEDYKWSGGIDGAAYSTDWGVFYTGRSLLILNGEEWKHITVDFTMPSDWQVTTPWNSVANRKNSFVVNNHTALMESMLFAGTHEEISLKRDDFTLVFALGGDEVIARKEEFENMAEGVLDYYISLMGGVPNPSPNNKFEKSIVIINSSDMTDGEQIGNNISMLIQKNGDAMSTMISTFIFAHEFFHLWNGKSFWPIDNDTEWFKEGFSNYYTLKSLHHIGFFNDTSFLDVLNSFFYQRYNADTGIGNLSMTKGEEKHDHWGLINGGGLFCSDSTRYAYP